MALNLRGYAIFSRDGRQRYLLRYRWAKRGKILVWWMLNPSTADETGPDPTLTRCIGFSQRHGYAGLIAVNTYPLVSTDPAGIKGSLSVKAAHYNQLIIGKVARQYPTVVAAWGGDCKSTPQQMHSLLQHYQFKRILCLGTTKAGQPRHPLYLSNQTEFKPWAIVSPHTPTSFNN